MLQVNKDLISILKLILSKKITMRCLLITNITTKKILQVNFHTFGQLEIRYIETKLLSWMMTRDIVDLECNYIFCINKYKFLGTME